MDKKEEGLPYPQMKQPSIDSTEVLTKDGKINWNLVECMHDADLEYVLSLDDQEEASSMDIHHKKKSLLPSQVLKERSYFKRSLKSRFKK